MRESSSTDIKTDLDSGDIVPDIDPAGGALVVRSHIAAYGIHRPCILIIMTEQYRMFGSVETDPSQSKCFSGNDEDMGLREGPV